MGRCEFFFAKKKLKTTDESRVQNNEVDKEYFIITSITSLKERFYNKSLILIEMAGLLLL